MGHCSSWSKDCLFIWANSFNKGVQGKQELTSTHVVLGASKAFCYFNCVFESLIHPAGAQPSIAPFTSRLTQNTQKHP